MSRSKLHIVLSAVAAAMAFLVVQPGAVLAEQQAMQPVTQSADWPAACICMSANPKYPRGRAAVFQVDDAGAAMLRARLEEIGGQPLHKTIVLRAACAQPQICAERRQVPWVGDAIRIRVVGTQGSDVFDAEERLVPEKLVGDARVVLWGAQE